jgi:hypothetical protein
VPISSRLQEAPISAELLTAIRSGHVRPEQKLAVCSGSASLNPPDRVESLAILAADSDENIADRAQAALASIPVDQLVAALSRADADARLFVFASENMGDKAAVADALAKNGACPAAVVRKVAAHLTAAGIQALLDDLERLTSDPELIIAVAQCNGKNGEQQELLADMEKGALALNELEEAIADAEPDPVKRRTLMQEVSRMTVVQRLTLALKGGRTERLLLIRDPNKLVQRCVLQSPRLTDTEVEAFASMTNLSAEVLRTISLTRLFIKNYSVVKNLVNNPKTPLDISLHLFPRLNATDLVKLTNNKNIPETLRSSATKLHRKRKMGGS